MSLEVMLIQQRLHLYSQIQSNIKLTVFNLILPMQQIAYADEIKLASGHGLCHGYGELWLDLLQQDKARFKFSWSKLLQNDTLYDFEEFKLTPQIRLDQRWQNLRHTELKKNYKSAKHFAASIELINYITQQCYADFSANKVFLIELTNYNPNSFFSRYNFFGRTWHQLRLYIDPQKRLHFFDANCGWFSSQKDNPTKEQLNCFLQMIFKIMQYKEDFNLVAISLTFNLNIKKTELTLKAITNSNGFRSDKHIIGHNELPLTIKMKHKFK